MKGGKVFIKVMEWNKIMLRLQNFCQYARIPPSHLPSSHFIYIFFYCIVGMTVYSIYTVLHGHITCCAYVMKSNVANLLGQEMYDKPAYGN